MSRALSIFSFLAPLLAFAGVSEKWVAETTAIEPHAIQAYHGETVNMECTLTERGRVIRPSTGDAYFLWQTNGMGDAWWCTNANYHCGLVKASFTPYMDPGGDSIQFFTLVDDKRGGNYRMNGEITMMRSPAGTFNVLPYPVKELDFARINVLNPSNAPFALKGEAGGYVTASLATNIAEYVVSTNGFTTSVYVDACCRTLAVAFTNYTDTCCRTLAVSATNYTDSATNNLWTATTNAIAAATTNATEILPAVSNIAAKTAAAMKPTKLGAYLWEVGTEGEDWTAATNRLAKVYPSWGGGCSGVKAGNYHGRNLDWYYDKGASIIVRSPAREGKYGAIGVAGGLKTLTDDFLMGEKWDDSYYSLPFTWTDGMNEKGVVIQSNVIPKDTAKSATWRTKRAGCIVCFAIIRYVLDRCATAQEAAQMINEKMFMPSEFNYDDHFLVSDLTSSYIVEDGHVYSAADVPTDLLTNFRCGTASYNADKTVVWSTVETYGQGLERYDLVRTNGQDKATLDGIVATMKDLWYTKSYLPTTVPFWYTEECGPESETGFPNLTVMNAKDNPSVFAGAVAQDRANYLAEHDATSSQYRGGKTWQTVHTAIYDQQNLTLRLWTQEDPTSERLFKLVRDKAEVVVTSTDYATVTNIAEYVVSTNGFITAPLATNVAEYVAYTTAAFKVAYPLVKKSPPLTWHTGNATYGTVYSSEMPTASKTANAYLKDDLTTLVGALYYDEYEAWPYKFEDRGFTLYIDATNDTAFVAPTLKLNDTWTNDLATAEWVDGLYRLKTSKIDWNDVTNHDDVATESITNNLPTKEFVADNYVPYTLQSIPIYGDVFKISKHINFASDFHFGDLSLSTPSIYVHNMSGGLSISSVSQKGKVYYGSYNAVDYCEIANHRYVTNEVVAATNALAARIPVVAASDPAFSNAVLSVALNIDTNSVAVLNEIAATFGGFPITGTATTLGGLLLALAAAIAWLKKHTVKTDGETSQQVSGELIVGDLNVVGGTKFAIVSSASEATASDTLYFITGSSS